MPRYWMVVIGLWYSAVFVLTGCKPSGSFSFAGDPAENVFLAAPMPVPSVPQLRVSNEIGGGITIVTGADGEVAPDVIATGMGTTLQSALEEADSHINLINTGTEIKVMSTAGANPQDRALLYVRVPARTILSAVTISQGNVGVYGRMSNVTASITGSGDINVLGANGDINLSTAQGSITAELAPGNNKVTAHAVRGNIDVIAVDAAVSANTTEGNVRFVGTLRGGATQVFSTTAGGNVTLAVPPHPTDPRGNALAYRVYASTSRNSIITNFPANQWDPAGKRDRPDALAICGVIHSPGPYHYDVATTSARFGHIEVRPSPTTTFFFSGTLTSEYFQFDTNQPQISLSAPRSQAIHIYTAADAAQMAAGKIPVDSDCEKALKTDPGQLPAIVLSLHSDSGRIFVHHITFVQ